MNFGWADRLAHSCPVRSRGLVGLPRAIVVWVAWTIVGRFRAASTPLVAFEGLEDKDPQRGTIAGASC